MVRKSYNSGSYVAYTYNAEGSLARLSYGDSTGELASYRFEYDSLGRLIRSAELDADGGTVQRTEHIYDGYNRLSRQSWTLGGKTYSESYVYDDPSDTNKNGDGALTQMTTATGAVIDYQYDTLRRLTRSEVTLNGSTVYTTAYAFRDLDASRTTTQVQYRNVRSANGTMLEGKKYTYDALGNITRISQSTKPFYTLVAYEYDAQNQLTKETYYDGEGTAEGNITHTISYTYDTAGNILSVTETAGDKTTTKAYTYGDSEWLDLLTAINGSAIQYDAGGNPTNWSNGKADLSLQWANGRRLTGASSESARKSESLSYAYDADGVRTSKSYTVLPVYTVTFVADSQTVKTMSVKDGYVLQDRDYPTVPEKSGYAGSWTKYTAAIHENITIQAVYSTGTHTVKFLGLRLIVIKTMTVEDGYVLKRSDYPAVPKKKGFIGKWNTYDDPIHSDITITATYVRDDGTMSLEETEEYDLGSDGGAAAGSDISKPVIYRVVTHEYLTQSGKVMRETIKTNQTVTAVLDFIYDESGKPFAMIDQLSAQPNTYYYVLNLQGDVVKLVTESGAVAASYEYDAWGNILASSGSMAEKNPLRYRGYYYDSETGFYYLQSRYYDPATRRFINADVYTSTGQGFVGTNMFAYCRNRPVNSLDINGSRDYIYTPDGNYTIENDWGFFEFLHVDSYYVEVDGKRYPANSSETASLHPWNSVDEDFMSTTFKTLVNKANEKLCTPYRILTESVKGELDFKLQLPENQLFYVDGVVYNRNECGNFIWAYYLETKGYTSLTSSVLAQGGSLLPGIARMDGTARFDEPWDVRARHHGVMYAILEPLRELIS